VLGNIPTRTRRLVRLAAVCAVVASLTFTSVQIHAYSVLTHEQVVDFLWNSDIKPILLDRYPLATAEELRQAHAFAYGGCLIQDMGYYPGGNKFFSDLVHYVRSGDFVGEMLRQASDLNEMAFALGALAHYASDTAGHPAINHAVPMVFPKLKKKYGTEVTYEDDKVAHVQTEFGFDVLEVAKQRYTSQAFHDFIGFQVSKDLLERAFLATYGLNLKDVLHDEDMAINSYRHAVSTWVPRLTQVALITKKQELEALPNFNAHEFRYVLKRSQYQKEWGKNYYRPNFFSKFLAVVVKILPKVGPLRALDVKPPTPETEKMYFASLEATLKRYQHDLRLAGELQVPLENTDLDTGRHTNPGEYKLADRAYSKLVKDLADEKFAQITPQLRENVLSFYGNLEGPFETRRHKEEWHTLLKNLEALRQQTIVAQQQSSNGSRKPGP
jgi:hypothetical protein